MEDDDHNQDAPEVNPLQYIRRDDIEAELIITETREQIVKEFEDISQSSEERSDIYPYLEVQEASPPSSFESMPNNVSESDYQASYKNNTITLG